MEISQELKERLESVLFNMNSERNYWFMRTMSGTLYDEYFRDGFVALGYDTILMRDLRNLPEREAEAREFLKLRLNATTQDMTASQMAKAAGQILKFYRSVNDGDVVIIPSTDSDKFAIGTFMGDMYEDSSVHEEGTCQFVKRRRVNWLTEVSKRQFDPQLLLCLGNQQTMSSVKSHSEYIDRKIAPLYTKGDKSYLVLRVNQDKGLSWDDFFFIADLGDLFKAVSEESGINVDLTQIEMKINVQSPGDIMLMCAEGLSYLLPVAVGILFIVGGHVKVGNFEFETKGLGDFFKQLSEAVTNYLDHKAERKIRLENRMRNMEIGVGNPKSEQAGAIEAGSEGSVNLPSPDGSTDGNAQTE